MLFLHRVATCMPKIGLFWLDPMLFLPWMATYMPKMANLVVGGALVVVRRSDARAAAAARVGLRPG